MVGSCMLVFTSIDRMSGVECFLHLNCNEYNAKNILNSLLQTPNYSRLCGSAVKKVVTI